MASLRELADDFFTCRLCLEKLREPRTLPCLHAFCKLCLAAHMRTSVENSAFPCPLCSQPTRPDQSGLSVDQWVETLTANPFIVSLLKVNEARHSEKACDICRQEKILGEAVKWCQTCLEALCEDCERVHMRSRASRDHNVVSIEHLENEALDKLVKPKRGSLGCSEHKGKQLSCVCVECRKFVCETCMAVSHAQCRRVETADKVVGDMRKSLDTSVEKLGKHRQNARKFTQLLQERLDLFTRSRDLAKDALHELVEKLVTSLYEKADKLTRDIEGTYENQRDLLTERLGRSQLAEVALEKSEKFLEHLLLYGTEMDVLGSFDLVTKQMQVLDRDMAVTMVTGTQMELKMVPDKKIQEVLRTVPSLGEVKLSKVSSKRRAELAQSSPAPKASSRTSTNQNPGSRRALKDKQESSQSTPQGKMVASFSGRGRNDTSRADLRSVISLRSGDVIVMDVHFRNQRLKKFTSRGKLLSQVDTGECPHAMALVSDAELAVSLPRSRHLAFVAVSASLHIVGKVKSPKSYFSLASSADGVLAAIGTTKVKATACVDFISFNGEVLNSIPLDRSRYPVIPKGLSFTPEGNVVLLLSGREMLLCLNMDGNPLFSFTPDKAADIKRPVAVACDSAGAIYVVDSEAHAVHALTSQGRYQGQLLTRRDGLREPLALHVTDAGHVIVTQQNGDVKLFLVK